MLLRRVFWTASSAEAAAVRLDITREAELVMALRMLSFVSCGANCSTQRSGQCVHLVDRMLFMRGFNLLLGFTPNTR